MKLNKLSDKQLEDAIGKLADKIDKLKAERNSRAQLGWRVICPGDTLNYGCHEDYLFAKYGKEEAYKRAMELALTDSSYHIEGIYPWCIECGVVH